MGGKERNNERGERLRERRRVGERVKKREQDGLRKW